MANFDHELHTQDLVHFEQKFFDKKNYDMFHILAMIPSQLTLTKETMKDTLQSMNDNLWYYHKIAAPLHNHKSYDEQMTMINDMYQNLT
jgi:hypothetical protein